MIYEPETVKGFQDILPPDSQKFHAIERLIEKHFKLYGFLPIKTPTIEFDELMRTNNVGEEDEAVSDRFRLQDRGGRNLGLRYEFTFQLARLFKQNPNIKLPLRRYQIGSVFRDEPTGQGRFKEFTQCDADIIGDSSIEADAECIALWSDILKALKIKAEIHISNKKLAYAILDSIQLQQKREILKELDKLDKLGEDTIKTNLKKYADANQILTLFKLLEKDLEFFVKNLFEGSDEIFKVQELGKTLGFTIKFNPFIVRGLSYYTGNVIEFKVAEGKHAIGGGGRYDGVAGRFLNRKIPAIGVSFGIERLMEYAQIKNETTKTLVISLEKDKEANNLAKKLRKENISCIMVSDKPGKALEYGNAYQIPYAIFIGAEELAKKKYKLKNMTSGEEKDLTEKKLISLLKKES